MTHKSQDSEHSVSSAASRVELSKLWTQAYPSILSFIRSSINDFHRCEDILQEVAVAIAESFDEYDRTRRFEAWALGIARNKVLYHLRTTSNDNLRFGRDTIEALAVAHLDTSHEISERQKALEECMGLLQARWKRILEMRYMNDYKPARIASATDMTANAVSILLHRIRKALRMCIERKLTSPTGETETRRRGC